MTEICLEGIEDNEKDQLETEIKDALGIFFENRKNPVRRIVVGKDFNETVIRYLDESSREKADYNQAHEYGVAVAKTIPEFQNGEISFNVILDKILFQRLDSVGRLDRIGTFIHEFTHAVDDMLMFNSIGEERFRSVPKLKKEYLFHNAWVIWQEYHAERYVIEVYEALQSEEMKFEYTPKLGNLKKLKELLENLPKFLQENISKFRRWQLTPGRICWLITSQVMGILYLYAYAFALSDGVTRFEDKVIELNYLDGCRFFSEGLPDNHAALLELYNKKNEYSPELIERIGNSIDSMLRKCGLEMKDALEGYSVEVHEI
jgi:hypothetical protein